MIISLMGLWIVEQGLRDNKKDKYCLEVQEIGSCGEPGSPTFLRDIVYRKISSMYVVFCVVTGFRSIPTPLYRLYQ